MQSATVTTGKTDTLKQDNAQMDATQQADSKQDVTNTGTSNQVDGEKGQNGQVGGDNKQDSQTDGENKDEPGLPEENSKINIANYEVTLDSYMVMADGKAHNPTVTGVLYEGDKDGDGNLIAGSEKTLTTKDYDVEYFAVRGGNTEKVENMAEAGEYIVKAVGKGDFEGEAQAYFTIVGKRQNMTITKTKYTLTVKSKTLKLSPEADGDGNGFSYVSGNPQVAEVSDDGVVRVKKAGRSTITILTTGNRLSHPAKIRVTIDVKPLKTYWTKKDAVSITAIKAPDNKDNKVDKDDMKDSAAGKKKSGKEAKVTLRWKSGAKSSETGVVAYEVMYGTSKDFKENTYETKIVKNSEKASLLTSFTAKKGKTYYVRVRGLAETTNSRNFTITLKGKWSSTKKIEVK